MRSRFCVASVFLTLRQRKAQQTYKELTAKERLLQQQNSVREGVQRKQSGAGGGAPPPLPEGWKEIKDPKTGSTYYWNKVTKSCLSFCFPSGETQSQVRPRDHYLTQRAFLWRSANGGSLGQFQGCYSLLPSPPTVTLPDANQHTSSTREQHHRKREKQSTAVSRTTTTDRQRRECNDPLATAPSRRKGAPVFPPLSLENFPCILPLTPARLLLSAVCCPSSCAPNQHVLRAGF